MVVPNGCFFLEGAFFYDLVACDVDAVLAVGGRNVSSAEEKAVDFVRGFPFSFVGEDGIAAVDVQFPVEVGLELVTDLVISCVRAYLIVESWCRNHDGVRQNEKQC